jgi:hypothetical protein
VSIPTTGTGIIPVTGVPTGGLPSTPVTSAAGFECGQIIINNTIYMVVVTTTTTTTTTTANGPQTVAAGPVTISTGSPTTASPLATTAAPAGSPRVQKKSSRPSPHHKTTVRKRSSRHGAAGHRRSVRLVLVRKTGP